MSFHPYVVLQHIFEESESVVEWLNEPVKWSWDTNELTIDTEPATDFWRVTGEGADAIRDNGHFYAQTINGEFDLSVDISGDFTEQYDQAGVMVRIDSRQWFKTGVEFLNGRPRFSTVVTFDYSNWMFSDLPASFDHLSLRISHRGDEAQVFVSLDGGPEEYAAHLYLPPNAEKLVGVMCAAPKGRGFEARFRNLDVATLT